MDEIYNEWLKWRPNYKKLKEWKTGLPPEIIRAYQTKEKETRGNTSRIITGPAGSGKSTYIYKVLAKTHYDFNGFTKVDEEEISYKFALDHIIYRPQELFNIVKKTLDADEQEIYICCDDASIHMGRQLFDQDRHAYRRLQGTVPTLRENFGGIFLTTIDVGLVAKPWREFIKRKVIIQKLQSAHYSSLAKHYEKWYFPDDVKFRIAILFQDRFSYLVPNPFYTWYHEKKMNALKEYNQSVMEKPVRHSGSEDEEQDAGL